MATILRELRRRLARDPRRVAAALAAALALPSLAQVLVVIPIAIRPVGVLVALWSTAAGGLGDSRLLVR